MAQIHRAGDRGQFLRFAEESRDFLQIIRNRPRIRRVAYFGPPRHVGAFSPNPERPIAIQVNGPNTSRVDTEAVSAIRLEISRHPEDHTQSALGPGCRVFRHTAEPLRPRFRIIPTDPEKSE